MYFKHIFLKTETVYEGLSNVIDYIRKVTSIPTIEELKERIKDLELYVGFLEGEVENASIELDALDVILLIDSDPIQTGISKKQKDD